MNETKRDATAGPDEAGSATTCPAPIGAGPDARPRPDAPLELGTVVGRYIVLEAVGEGGMGRVYSAFDPQLDRRVALKVLHAVAGVDAPTLRQEAKVLARLAHPNVVTVHDLGLHQGRVFMAMELVEGGTLRAWAEAEPRTWQEVARMMAATAEGLLAAHRSGFVHRDFKPENVLVGRDGRPRVTDFGLASQPQQRAWAVVGAPAYMPPEQITGAGFDARADIFAFSVTLYELLFGTRPFTGRTLEELRVAIVEQQLCEPLRGRTVPAGLRALVLRGLEADPARRPSSLEEFLGPLRRDPHRRRRRVFGVGGLAVVASLGGMLAQRALGERERSCQAEGAVIEATWGATRRGELERAFIATGVPYARAALAGTAPLLDAYAERWAAMHLEACEATRVHRTQPVETLTLRTRCLSERRAELEALLALLTRADATTVEKAASAVSGLTPVAGCADTVALATPQPRPTEPEVLARLEAAVGELNESHALALIGRGEEALARARPALETLRRINHQPSLAFAEYLVAAGELRRGELDASATHARAALIAAQRGHEDAAAVDALGVLTQTEGFAGRTELALFYAELALAMVDRAGRSASERIEVRAARVQVLAGAGRLDEAVSELREVVAVWEQEFGPEHLNSIEAHSNLGALYSQQGRLEASRRELATAVAAFERVLGPSSPGSTLARSNLGVALLLLGRPDEAAPLLESTNAELLARDSGVYVPMSQSSLGQLRRVQGRFDEAIALQRDALSRLEAMGPEATLLVEPLRELGRSLVGAGRAAEALVPLERALAISAQQPLPQTELAQLHFALAQTLVGLGRERPRARMLAERALGAWRDAAARYGEENELRVKELEAFVRTLE